MTLEFPSFFLGSGPAEAVLQYACHLGLLLRHGYEIVRQLGSLVQCMHSHHHDQSERDGYILRS